MSLHKLLALITASLLLVLVVAIWLFPLNDDFSLENPFWNGLRNLSRAHPVVAVSSFTELPPSPQGATLILIPYLGFTPAELSQLRDYVAGGGNLVLADDYGDGNEVLQYLGLTARFSGETLLDPLDNYKNKNFPKVFDIQPDNLMENVQTLVLDHATSLTDVEKNLVLARSSSFSFLDANDNGEWDENEIAGPLPVIAQQSLGKGQIILVADPSILINSMATLENNNNFMENIAAMTTTQLLIDQSHLPPANLSGTKKRMASLRGILNTPTGTAVLVIIALAVALLPLWYERRQKIDQSAG